MFISKIVFLTIFGKVLAKNRTLGTNIIFRQFLNFVGWTVPCVRAPGGDYGKLLDN